MGKIVRDVTEISTAHDVNYDVILLSKNADACHNPVNQQHIFVPRLKFERDSPLNVAFVV